jgi:hypothetical protein
MNDADVEIVGHRELPRPPGPADAVTGFRTRVNERLALLPGLPSALRHLGSAAIQNVLEDIVAAETAEPWFRARMQEHHRNMHAHLVPIEMDYTLTGFNLGGLESHGSSPPPPPSHPTIPPAPHGFTRDPKENETYVCPNCEEELCSGDDDIKKQVWVVKGCGHVYCGECAKNRFITKAKKAKVPPRTNAFKVCVVDGCTVKTSGQKAMTQLYI